MCALVALFSDAFCLHREWVLFDISVGRPTTTWIWNFHIRISIFPLSCLQCGKTCDHIRLEHVTSPQLLLQSSTYNSPSSTEASQLWIDSFDELKAIYDAVLYVQCELRKIIIARSKLTSENGKIWKYSWEGLHMFWLKSSNERSKFWSRSQVFSLFDKLEKNIPIPLSLDAARAAPCTFFSYFAVRQCLFPCQDSSVVCLNMYSIHCSVLAQRLMLIIAWRYRHTRERDSNSVLSCELWDCASERVRGRTRHRSTIASDTSGFFFARRVNLMMQLNCHIVKTQRCSM